MDLICNALNFIESQTFKGKTPRFVLQHPAKIVEMTDRVVFYCFKIVFTTDHNEQFSCAHVNVNVERPLMSPADSRDMVLASAVKNDPLSRRL